jgi:hypothetical protein
VRLYLSIFVTELLPLVGILGYYGPQQCILFRQNSIGRFFPVLYVEVFVVTVAEHTITSAYYSTISPLPMQRLFAHPLLSLQMKVAVELEQDLVLAVQAEKNF